MHNAWPPSCWVCHRKSERSGITVGNFYSIVPIFSEIRPVVYAWENNTQTHTYIHTKGRTDRICSVSIVMYSRFYRNWEYNYKYEKKVIYNSQIHQSSSIVPIPANALSHQPNPLTEVLIPFTVNCTVGRFLFHSIR